MVIVTMTQEEIEGCWAELRDIQKVRIEDYNKGYREAKERLPKLALRVGAEPLLEQRNDRETMPELVHRIHQALQTASMIDACRTAAKNHEVALAAVKETAESQRISKHTMIAAWVAAIAAWAAVILPPVVRFVWARFH
jgi:hypothetical protein